MHPCPLPSPPHQRPPGQSAAPGSWRADPAEALSRSPPKRQVPAHCVIVGFCSSPFQMPSAPRRRLWFDYPHAFDTGCKQQVQPGERIQLQKIGVIRSMSCHMWHSLSTAQLSAKAPRHCPHALPAQPRVQVSALTTGFGNCVLTVNP